MIFPRLLSCACAPRRLLSLAAGFLITASALHADDVVWDFGTASALSASPISQPANLTVSAVTQGNNNGTTTMLTAVSTSSGYTGSSAGGNAGAASRTGAYDAAQSAYFEVTLTPAANYRVTVTGLAFGTRRTTTGPVNYQLRTSADNYLGAAATGALPAASAWGYMASSGLSVLSSTPLTIRIFGVDGVGASSANTANWRIDDLKLSVVTAQDGAPVPTITDVSPLSGSVGTNVTITGTNFGAATVVRFNGTPAVSPAVNPEGTGISATVPAGATTGPVTVTTNGGAANSAQPFTVVPLPALTVLVNPSSFGENAAAPSASGTVTIPAALGASLTVTLTSSNTAAATLPSGTVIIPAGNVSAPFTVNAVPNPASFANATSTITATAAGHDQGTFLVTVTNTDAATTSVVINKYLNSSPDMIELLVIGNGTPGSTVDLRRMLIKDHSASMANDGGGKFRFNNDAAAAALFSNLKAGTLIVLSNSNTSTDTDPSDFLLRLGLTDTSYFTSEGGTFDIATTEVVMLKSQDAVATGGVGAMHTLAGGVPGQQFTDAPPKKLIATGTSGTGLGVVANNATSSLADYDGTGATGATALTAAAFGVANNLANNTYIRALRGSTSVDGAGVATITNSTTGSTFIGRNYFPRSTPAQNVDVSILSNANTAPLTSAKVIVPAAFGAPNAGSVGVSGAGAGSPIVSVSGQEVTVTGIAATTTSAAVITIGALGSPNPTAVTDDGRYPFTVQTAGDAGALTAIATSPAAVVPVPVASLRDVNANGVPLDLGKIVAVEVVCTTADLDSAVRTSAYGQDGAAGINIFIQGVELNLQRGKRYGITGTLIQFSGLTEINPASAADVFDLGAGVEPAPLTVTVPDLLANAEAYEGRLLKVVSLSYVSGTWGLAATVAAADASANALDVRIQSGSAATTSPSWPATITGILGQADTSSPFSSGYQIMPRTNADVESLGGGPGYDGWAAAYPGIGLPEDDGDHDGASNLLEYATGSIPNSAGSLPQTAQSLIGDTLTVVWAKGTAAANDPALAWSIESSATMAAGTWNHDGLLNFNNGPASISADYVLTAVATRRSFRLRIVRTP